MEEKIIREKNRTSMKKIANDESMMIDLKNKRRWRLWTVVCGAATDWSRGDYGVRAGLLAAGRRSKEERK